MKDDHVLLYMYTVKKNMYFSSGQATCKSMKLNNPAAPSKMYTIDVASSDNATKQIDVNIEFYLLIQCRVII